MVRSSLLVLTLLVLGSAAHAAGIRCERASSPDEKAICASPELRALDSDIADLYARLLSRLSPDEKSALRAEQRAWIEERGTAPLADMMNDRRIVLKSRLALVLAKPRSVAGVSNEDLAFGLLLSTGGTYSQTEPRADWSEIDLIDDHPRDVLELQLRLARLPAFDINAYRHHGSLLHHALRMRLEKMVPWLLQRGASVEAQVVEDDGKTAGRDALWLAIEYENWEAFGLLLRQPGVQWDDRYWAAAGTAAALQHLHKANLPLPSGDNQRCLLQAALNMRVFGLALRMADLAPLLPWPPHADDDSSLDLPPTTMCTSLLVHQSVWLAEDYPEDIEAQEDAWSFELPDRKTALARVVRLDQRLQAPLLPWLLLAAKTEADITALRRSGLRRPANDPAFVRQLLYIALDKKLPAGPHVLPLLRDLPPASLQAALADEHMLRRWLPWALALPQAEGDWALRQVTPTTRQQFPQAVVSSLLTHDGPISNARWIQLLTGLGPATAEEQKRFRDDSYVYLDRIPVAAATLLGASGLWVDTAPLLHWLNTVDDARFPQAWEVATRLNPAVQQPALRAMLTFYPHSQSAVCPPVRSEEELRAFANRLAHARRHGSELPAGLLLCDAVRRTAPRNSAALVREGYVQGYAPPLKRQSRRALPVQASCALQPDSQGRLVPPGVQPSTSAQAVTYYALRHPGSDACALLQVNSWEDGMTHLPGMDSFTYGTRAPWVLCPVLPARYTVHVLQDGAWVAHRVDISGDLELGTFSPALDVGSGQVRYIGGLHRSLCDPNEPVVLQWDEAGNTLQLLHPDDDLTRMMLAEQSELDGQESHNGSTPVARGRLAVPGEGMSVDGLLKQLRR